MECNIYKTGWNSTSGRLYSLPILQHGQYDFVAGDRKINPCYLPSAGSIVGSLLTSIDVGADGHMAGGSADLKCSGYEPK